MDDTTAVVTAVAATVAALAAFASGVISWLNRRDAKSADLKGELQALRSKMENGFAEGDKARKGLATRIRKSHLDAAKKL